MSLTTPETDERLDTGLGEEFTGTVELLAAFSHAAMKSTAKPVRFTMNHEVIGPGHFHCIYVFTEPAVWYGPLATGGQALYDEHGQLLLAVVDRQVNISVGEQHVMRSIFGCMH